MRDEVSGKRPSPLSSVFRKHAADGAPLADWTRHIDGDWVWYCPQCYRVVILIEEKTPGALQKAWNVTRRLATGHEDRPWGWRVTCLGEDKFSVVGARAGNGSFGDKEITELELVRWIERAFEQHYLDAQHPRREAA